MRCISFTWRRPTCCSASTPTSNRRNIVGVAQAHPDIAKKGVLLRKFGQEVIRVTAGKRVHGTGSVPGGMNKHVSAEDRALLQRDVAQMTAWAQDAVGMAKQLHAQNPALYNSFGSFRSSMLSLVRADGAMDLYDGVIRARDAAGQLIFDGASDQGYLDLIEEEVKPWTYMKFPFLKSLGRRPGLVPGGAAGAACRTATSFPARWLKSSARRSSPGAVASPSTPRWPTTGRA